MLNDPFFSVYKQYHSYKQSPEKLCINDLLPAAMSKNPQNLLLISDEKNCDSAKNLCICFVRFASTMSLLHNRNFPPKLFEVEGIPQRSTSLDPASHCNSRSFPQIIRAFRCTKEPLAATATHVQLSTRMLLKEIRLFV